MDLLSKRCGCGSVFRLVHLRDRATQCVACQRRVASAMERPVAKQIAVSGAMVPGVWYTDDGKPAGDMPWPSAGLQWSPGKAWLGERCSEVAQHDLHIEVWPDVLSARGWRWSAETRSGVHEISLDAVGTEPTKESAKLKAEQGAAVVALCLFAHRMGRAALWKKSGVISKARFGKFTLLVSPMPGHVESESWRWLVMHGAAEVATFGDVASRNEAKRAAELHAFNLVRGAK